MKYHKDCSYESSNHQYGLVAVMNQVRRYAAKHRPARHNTDEEFLLDAVHTFMLMTATNTTKLKYRICRLVDREGSLRKFMKEISQYAKWYCAGEKTVVGN